MIRFLFFISFLSISCLAQIAENLVNDKEQKANWKQLLIKETNPSEEISWLCGLLSFFKVKKQEQVSDPFIVICSFLDKRSFDTIRLVRKVFSEASKKAFLSFGLKPKELDKRTKTYLINKHPTLQKISFKWHKKLESLDNFLTNFHHLTHIDFSWCSKLTNLQNLPTTLTSVDLGCCDSITNEGVESLVTKCPNLKDLNLYCIRIKSFEKLAILTNLTKLNLWGNEIKEVGPLATLTNLKELNLIHNQIVVVDPLAKLSLAKLTNLTMLYLWKNQIIKVDPLAKLTNLKKLSLWENQIKEVGSLAKLTNLTELDLRHNQIVKIDLLARLTNLTSLNLIENPITQQAREKLEKALENTRIFF